MNKVELCSKILKSDIPHNIWQLCCLKEMNLSKSTVNFVLMDQETMIRLTDAVYILNARNVLNRLLQLKDSISLDTLCEWNRMMGALMSLEVGTLRTDVVTSEFPYVGIPVPDRGALEFNITNALTIPEPEYKAIELFCIIVKEMPFDTFNIEMAWFLMTYVLLMSGIGRVVIPQPSISRLRQEIREYRATGYSDNLEALLIESILRV